MAGGLFLVEISEATLIRLTGAIEERNKHDKPMTDMWCKTLNLSEIREKRLTYLIWALVIANVFLATGHIMRFIPFP